MSFTSFAGPCPKVNTMYSCNPARRLIMTSCISAGEELGTFYLDPFSREDKHPVYSSELGRRKNRIAVV